MFLFSLYFIKTTVVKELSEIYILYCTAWKIFCKQENTSEILMEAKSCILDTVWSIYLYQAEMLHCNVCVCYHEITHAFWELGNISPCLSLQQNSRNYLMAISKPKMSNSCKKMARRKQTITSLLWKIMFLPTDKKVSDWRCLGNLNYLYAST